MNVGLSRRNVVLFATAAFATASGAAAAPGDDVRIVRNPPLLGASPAPAGVGLTAGTGPDGTPGIRILDLNVDYVDGKLFNPAENRFDAVRLRGYTGTGMKPDAPYVSPTIEIRPGETVRINLNNKLPPVTDRRFDPGCAMADAHSDNPHCFNGTNLHTHGLWVNPSGNGDNVLLSINPGVKFTYEYNIPDDHPSGTFWYHTHRHGSTALQVSSGMAGALIIRGNRPPTATRNGDLDTLLNGVPERVLVFQQIQYACLKEDGSPKLNVPPSGPAGTYRCDPGDTGRIESYDIFGPEKWARSGRYTSVNGVVLARFQARQGEVERWRMIHAGVRDTINLRFVKARPNISQVRAPRGAKELIASTCTGAGLDYNVVAGDGLTMAAARRTQREVFQPGYRWDALVVFPEPGLYCVLDEDTPGAGTVGADKVPTTVLGFVEVAAGTPVPGGDVTAYVQSRLAANARRDLPMPIQGPVVADLENGLKLTHFVPHPTIAPGEVTGFQQLTFYIDQTKGVRFEVGNTLNVADTRPYDPNRIDRKLVLGGVDEWTLTSQLASHPFHIHVNPFQVVSITDPNGKDVSAEGAVDDYGVEAGRQPDPGYPGLKGVWKDTLWVKSLTKPDKSPAIYVVTIRTRYERYIGEYVLHCHILDHEDHGMMQNVAVVLPEGDVAANARGDRAGAGTASGSDHDHH